MKIEIDFTPDDGPQQTLYANLDRAMVDFLRTVLSDPDSGNDTVILPISYTPDGTPEKRLFRVGRIAELREA